MFVFQNPGEGKISWRNSCRNRWIKRKEQTVSDTGKFHYLYFERLLLICEFFALFFV